MAKIPPVSSRHVPKFVDADHRRVGALSFKQDSQCYHQVRPSYPQSVVQLLAPAARVLDVGAGTGKLTRQLIDDPQFQQVYACDPSADMLGVLANDVSLPVWQATAEHTGAENGFFAALTCAQTWHWVDPVAACAEFSRITTSDAQVLLVWNTLDVRVAWVHRLSRIMHSGDTLASGFYPTVYPPWQIVREHRSTWQQHLSVRQVHQLMRSRSYWLRSKDKTRAKVTANLQWYLTEHLGHAADAVIDLPYRCDGFLLQKSNSSKLVY